MNIPKVSAGDVCPEDFYESYIRTGLPVILTGALDNWPLGTTWTFEYLQRVHGELQVRVHHNGLWKTTQLGPYIEKLCNGREDNSEVGYLRTWNFERLGPSRRPPFTWLFLGPPGAETKLHVDVWQTDAWLAQLQGRKRFILYHPSHRQYLEDDDGNLADQTHLDPARFPDAQRAVAWQCVLEPGQVIYIPRRLKAAQYRKLVTVLKLMEVVASARHVIVAWRLSFSVVKNSWPHAVESLDATLSLTRNFLPPCALARVAKPLTAYLQRRDTCEALLGRTLRASDNLLKFCVHGGSLPVHAVKDVLNPQKQMQAPGVD